MKVLVTGGAGFIGSHVCDALLKRGDRVLCVDNFNDYYNPQRKWKNVEPLLKNENFKLFNRDIKEVGDLEEVFSEGVDKVVHLAARAGVRASIECPDDYVRDNINGLLNMLELCKKFKVKSFVFASSSSVYGNRSDGPFKETDNVDNPISPYAATKKSGELLCHTYSHLFGLNVTCLRFFTVYGSRGRPDMAPFKFTDKIARGEWIEIYGDGNAVRDFTHVSDTVRGVLLALDKDLKYEIINLGNSRPVRLMELVKAIESSLGKEARMKFVEPQVGDVALTHSDSSKARELLGFEAKVSLQEGVRELVDWYKENIA